jgi:NAD(P)-dependent dehydrogenase (short-subunit alcohol dehydrogenase family)
MNDFLDTALDRSIAFGYTNIGYKLRSGDFAPLPSMKGKTVVITGATSGLGEAAARQMAALSADLVIVARNEAKAQAIVDELRSTGANATYELADLSSMTEVRDLTKGLSRLDRIDVLVNNAGFLFGQRELTEEGLEQTFALNLLSQYILTTGLLPLLEKSAPSRVIMVSSGGMYSEKIHAYDLEYRQGTYTGTSAYARTKRGQVILTEEWAQAWKDTAIVVNSMHPGWAATPAIEKALPRFRKIVGGFLRSPDQGADTITFLAAADEAGQRTGLFWHDRVSRPTHIRSATQESSEERAAFLEELERYAGQA